VKLNPLIFRTLLIGLVVINLIGIDTPFFTDDPGLYASVAKQMIYHHNWFFLYSYGHDWLDKPHFPFWMVLLSFKAFGIHTWSYKLPGILFFFIGIYYTYLFAKKYYGINVAQIAVLIALSTLHGLMSNTDVRAEPYLFGLLIGSIYYVSELKDRFKIRYLLYAAIFTSCALMTKGIFIIIPIYGGLIGELFFKKELKLLLNYRWVCLYMLTIILCIPEFYALYQQFDLHPEKKVFGHYSTSGIIFLLWDSQFGRFFNSGPITRKSSSIFFYLHTLIWAFAPWCFLLYVVLIEKS